MNLNPTALKNLRLGAPAACALLLVAHGILLAWSAVWNSATFDEPAHLAAGVEYWRHGDFSIYSLSPPLLHLLGGALPALAGADAPPVSFVQSQPVSTRHWIYNDPFAYANFDRFPFLLILARCSMIPLSLLAGWIVYRWAAVLYGPAAGVAACAIYCFNPTVLAHGSLFTTDLGTAAIVLLSAWLWWKFCRAPSVWGFVWLCLALLAAHLCKFTAVLLWPMMFVMAFPFIAATGNARKIILGGVGSLCFVIFAINALYGFKGTGSPISSFTFNSDFMQHLESQLGPRFPSPMPRLIMEGFDAQKEDTQGGYRAFLFGEIYEGSRWYYYPAALLCKMPVSLLVSIAMAVSSMSALRTIGPKLAQADHLAPIAAVVIFVLGILILSDVNIGTRYLLPAFPLAAILISSLWDANASMRAGMRYLRNGLLLLAIVESLAVAPRFLSFINIAAGGSDNGYKLLTDSDFDWGQSLPDLRRWMKANQVPRVTLAYFGLIDPKIYGVDYTPLVDRDKIDPYIAFSSYYVDGLANRMVIGPNARVRIHIFYSRALQNRTPVAIVGHTILIYRRDDVLSAALEGEVP